jgi:hypothetical protein
MLVTLLSRSLTSVDVWFRCTGVGMAVQLALPWNQCQCNLLEPISKPAGREFESLRARRSTHVSIPVR